LVETLYRGLADNSVGRLIDSLLRADLLVVDELGFVDLSSGQGCRGLDFRELAKPAANKPKSCGRRPWRDE
jgi:hypothetical protein